MSEIRTLTLCLRPRRDAGEGLRDAFDGYWPDGQPVQARLRWLCPSMLALLGIDPGDSELRVAFTLAPLASFEAPLPESTHRRVCLQRRPRELSVLFFTGTPVRQGETVFPDPPVMPARKPRTRTPPPRSYPPPERPAKARTVWVRHYSSPPPAAPPEPLMRSLFLYVDETGQGRRLPLSLRLRPNLDDPQLLHWLDATALRLGDERWYSLHACLLPNNTE